MCRNSELIKRNPNSKLRNWISKIEENDLYISVLTFGEIQKGISNLPESKKKSDLTKWFFDLRKRFESRTLSIDINIAEHWGNMQAELERERNVMPSIDALIASTAKIKAISQSLKS